MRVNFFLHSGTGHLGLEDFFFFGPLRGLVWKVRALLSPERGVLGDLNPFGEARTRGVLAAEFIARESLPLLLLMRRLSIPMGPGEELLKFERYDCSGGLLILLGLGSHVTTSPPPPPGKGTLKLSLKFPFL